MRRQRQYPTAGGLPQPVGLRRTSRVVIPIAANDNARAGTARAAFLIVTALMAAGLLLAGLLG